MNLKLINPFCYVHFVSVCLTCVFVEVLYFSAYCGLGKMEPATSNCVRIHVKACLETWVEI